MKKKAVEDSEVVDEVENVEPEETPRTKKSKRKIAAVDESGGADESFASLAGDVEDELTEEERQAKQVRRAIRRVGKLLKLSSDELPPGFVFPEKEEVIALDDDCKEIFFDQAAALSERIVDLSTRILDTWGHGSDSRNGLCKKKLAMKAFEPAELWRQASGFGRQCCSKAVKAIHEIEEQKQTTKPSMKVLDDFAEQEEGPDFSAQRDGLDEASNKQSKAAEDTFMKFYMSQFTDSFANELDEIRREVLSNP